MTPRSLADRLEIIEVCTRLHWCVDHRDWDGLDDLLADRVSFPTPAEMAVPGFDPANYRRSRAEVKAAYPGLLAGLITQHLIAGHQVELDGDRAVCRAHAINVHRPEGVESGALVLHGNDYRFELVRAGSWRISARQTWIRWRWGDEAHYDVDERMLAWSRRVRPADAQPRPELPGNSCLTACLPAFSVSVNINVNVNHDVNHANTVLITKKGQPDEPCQSRSA